MAGALLLEPCVAKLVPTVLEQVEITHSSRLFRLMRNSCVVTLISNRFIIAHTGRVGRRYATGTMRCQARLHGPRQVEYIYIYIYTYIHTYRVRVNPMCMYT